MLLMIKTREKRQTDSLTDICNSKTAKRGKITLLVLLLLPNSKKVRADVGIAAQSNSVLTAGVTTWLTLVLVYL
jgi:hypothetical protein